jgi:hypothetical protein
MTTFADRLALARKVAIEEFARSYPDAVLLIEAGLPASQEGVLDTERVSPEEALRRAAQPAISTEPRVEPLRKRSGSNAFMSMITIGRATNNDVVLDARGISKFHAYVLREPGGGFTLVDAGSSYGTHVNERPVKPREEKVPLRGGEAITFGSVRTTFHLPATLYVALRRIGAPPPRI